MSLEVNRALQILHDKISERAIQVAQHGHDAKMAAKKPTPAGGKK
jgi:hypothetical protein